MSDYKPAAGKNDCAHVSCGELSCDSSLFPFLLSGTFLDRVVHFGCWDADPVKCVTFDWPQSNVGSQLHSLIVLEK